MYKYLPHPFAESALRKGEFKITTYGTCRSLEKIGDRRVDDEEGSAFVSNIIERWSSGDAGELPFGLPAEAAVSNGVTFINTELGGRVDTPDAYLYCMSDLPLNFHPVGVRVSAVDTPCGAV